MGDVSSRRRKQVALNGEMALTFGVIFYDFDAAVGREGKVLQNDERSVKSSSIRVGCWQTLAQTCSNVVERF